MKLPRLLLLPAFTATLHAAVDLKLDFNDRSNDTPANTEPGFTPFVITSTAGTPAITGATVNSITVGAQTVTIRGTGTANSYDDRKRTAPVNGGAFTQQALLQDFVFATYVAASNPNAGLDITVSGLEAGKAYLLTVWSFDTDSNGTRVSDWSVNGVLEVDNYTFDGRVEPTANTDRQLNFTATADAAGVILLSARRDPTSVDAAATPAPSHGVYLNALWVRDNPTDTDGDGMSDSWEILHGLLVGPDDSALDPDNDGSLNLQEFTADTDPQDSDTDNDSLLDGMEKNNGTWASAVDTGTNPRSPDSDNDGLGDAVENPDLPWTGPAQPGTNPNRYDTDTDGFGDGTEVNWPAHPRDALFFPNPGLGGTLSVDLENTAAVAQPGFETLPGSGATDAASVSATFGTSNVTIAAAGSTTLQSRDRAAAAGGGDFNPLFRDFIFAQNSGDDGDGMDVTITGLEPLTYYPVTLWSWDPTSAGTPRHSTWLASNGNGPPVVKVPVYSLEGATLLPASPSDRRMQFIALTNPSGELVIQGRKENGYVTTPVTTVHVILNAFVIGAPVPDSDDDLMPDAWETAHGLDPQVDDAALDADNDFLNNLGEYEALTNPQDNDSDDDTLLDGYERSTGVYTSTTSTGTNPLNPDTDGDGLRDGVENPNLVFTPPHGFPGTDPNIYDTDADGFGDGTELNWPSNPRDALLFPNPAAGATLAVDLEDLTAVLQSGFQAFTGTGTADAASLNAALGAYNVTIAAAGSTTLQSRDRAAAAGGGDFNPLFRDFIFAANSADDDDGLDVTITGLTPDTEYPVTLWSWDPSSTGTPRHSTWLASDGDNGPVIKVPLYINAGAPPASPADRRMQFTAKSDSTGQLVIQGRKEAGYAPASAPATHVFLNAFIIGAPVVPAPPLAITALGPWTPAGLTLTWSSAAGLRYKVEASPDLAGWTILNDNVTGQAGATSYTDTTAAGAPDRFYRVSLVPQ